MTMKVFRLVFICLLLIGTIAGCKKDDSSPAAPPPASGTVTEVEPNDQTAQALGALGTTDVTVNGSGATVSDIDRYSIILGATTNLHADITWTGGGDLGVGIMNPAGIMLTFRNTGTSPRGCTLSVPAGTYTIYVNANGGTGYPQAYALKIGPR
jgi:hypothetical protein